MTVQQLQYVLEVNKAGSITKAAKNLFVCPAPASSASAKGTDCTMAKRYLELLDEELAQV